jgi:catechol 2,3-dioxygenase-like lactoylglutathione lyase family enzyme
MANGKWQMARTAARFAIVLLSAIAVAQTSQTGAAGARMNPEAKPVFKANGGFVAITVPDLDASAKWYVEKLGLKIVKDHAMRPDKKAAVTVLEGSGFAVELIWLADSAPLSKVAPQVKGPQEIHGILKSGIFVDDLDAALKELKSRNVTMAFDTFYDKSMDCRMFAIRDNNGNILQFFGK